MDTRDRIARICLIVAIFLFLFSLISKISITLQNPLNSDSVQGSLLRDDIIRNHNYLLKGWYLPDNSYLFTEFPIYSFFETLLGAGTLSHRLSTFFIFIISLLLFFLLIRRIFGMSVALVSVLFIASGSLFSALQITLCQYVHLSTFNMSLLGLLLFISVFFHQGNVPGGNGQNKKMLIMVLFVLIILTVFSDKYMVFIFIIPLILSLAEMKFMSIPVLMTRKISFIAVFLFIAAIAGIVLQKTAAHWGLNLVAISFTVAGLRKCLFNIFLYFLSLAEIFNFDLLNNTAVAGVVFRGVNALFFISILLGVLLYFAREKDPIKSFMVLYSVNSCLIISSAFIMSVLPFDLNSARYLIPVFFSFALFASLSMCGETSAMSPRVRSVIIGVFLIQSLFNSFECLHFRGHQPERDLALYLEREGLHYGYASHWHSNIITYFSKNKVRVRAVSMNNWTMKPLLWFSKAEWYSPSYYRGPTFLIVPRTGSIVTEAGIVDLESDYMEALCGKPDKIIISGDNDICIWQKNIVADLDRVALCQALPMDIEIPRDVGKIEEEGEGAILVAHKGKSGTMVKKMSIGKKEGKYLITLFARARGEEDKTAGIVRIDIIDRRDKSSVRSIEKEIKAGANPEWDVLDIAVNTKGYDPQWFCYELNMTANGSGEVQLRNLFILLLND